MVRLHRGQQYERFFWRDMCGELPQLEPWLPPRFALWEHYGKSSDLADWLNLHKPSSDECERRGMDFFLTYHWPLDVSGHDWTDIWYTIEWDFPARTVEGALRLEWGSGFAEAKRKWTQPPQISPVPSFSLPMLWDTHSTTNPSVWDWGTGSVQTFLQIDYKPWM